MQHKCRFYHCLHLYKKKKNSAEQTREQFFCFLHSREEIYKDCSYLEDQRLCPDFDEEIDH